VDVKYFHRTSVSPDEVMARATEYFGARLTPVHEGPRRRSWSGGPGTVTVTVEAEGGHYTLVTLITDQPAESEMDKFGKRFLGEVHRLAEPSHRLRGAY
jgi:hypothetical protein